MNKTTKPVTMKYINVVYTSTDENNTEEQNLVSHSLCFVHIALILKIMIVIFSATTKAQCYGT